MPRLLPLALALVLAACSAGRAVSPGPSAAPATPEEAFDADRLAADLRFLASDELMGRKAGTPGADVAARYIAEQFRAAGARPAPGADAFLQPIPFRETAPPRAGRLVLLGDTLRQGERLLLLEGEAADLSAPAVFAGYGLTDADYEGVDAAGKVVVVHAGRPDAAGVQAAFRAGAEKRAAAAARGAIALVELYAGDFPWANLVQALATPRFGLDESAGAAPLPHAWVDAADGTLAERLAASETTAALWSPGIDRRAVTSSNVVAYVEGRDPARRGEYLVLTAHYDHVGAGLRNGRGATPADSIFNGARDNAMGVTAVMAAARAFAARPPARSVLFVAFTAEENGLLGSRYFVEHPPVPLDRMIYTLNIDGGGYSDTTIVTVVGLGRTTADDAIRQGAADFGLEAIADPAPEQNLFDRSDNVHFARRGIPAPTFSAGFRSFSDPGVMNYYHNAADEAGEDFAYGYLHRYAQAYTRVARYIADGAQAPFWVPGDTYEEAGRALYGMSNVE